MAPAVDDAIDDAIDHLRAFDEHQLAGFGDWEFEAEPGLRVGEKVTPIASVGLFVPSGKASYPSVAYQLGVPAVVAGVPQIALVVPPVPGTAGRAGGLRHGAIDPAVLVVCRKLSISDVFRANGPAGIAALGFGTETIPRVRKIVGPGSPPVTIAQVEMQRHGVTTMMLLGPTESLVIADATADPHRLAADLLIEAEHGTDTSVVLVSVDDGFNDAVDAELARQLAEPGPRPRPSAPTAHHRRSGREGGRGRQPLHAPRAPPGRRRRERPGGGGERGREILVGQHTPFGAAHRLPGVAADVRVRPRVMGVRGGDVHRRTAVARADEALAAWR